MSYASRKAEHTIEMDMQAHNVLNQNIKEGFGLETMEKRVNSYVFLVDNGVADFQAPTSIMKLSFTLRAGNF